MYRAFRRYVTEQRVSSFLLIFAIVLASCASPDVVTDPDWCYTFNYLTNDYETNFTAGSWLSGTGFIPNSSNDLSFSYSNGQTVSAAQVIITVARPEGVTGDITGLGNGIIFGITPPISPFPLSLASELESAELPITAEGLSDSGATMNISVSTDKPFALESIHVRGWGVNPFPFNECPKGTPTVTASATNVATLAPTSTDISTETGTPAPTPTQGACLLPGQSSPTITPGPSPTPIQETYLNQYPSMVDDALIAPSYPEIGVGDASFSGGRIVNNGGKWVTFTVTFPADVDLFEISLTSTYSGTSGGRQGSRVWNAAGTLLYDAGGGSGAPNVNTYIQFYDIGGLDNVRRVSFGYSRSNFAYIDMVKIVYNYEDPPTPTPLPDCTPTPTASPSVSPTATLTRTPTPSRTPVTLTPTISPTPSRTLAPVIVPSQTPPPATSPPTLVYPSLTPNPGVTNTPVPNTPAPGTPSWTGTPNMTATSLALGTPFPGSGVNPGDGGGLVGDIGGLGTGMIGAGSNIMSRATGWMNSVTGTFTNIVNGYFYAIPQAPPSVPRCATAPLESELCAIYFFLTHTVLSGTVGSVIIPLATIVVTLVVLFAFIRLARAILGRAMEATKS